MNRWTDDDSAALDRRILAERKASARAARRKGHKPPPISTINYTRAVRREATGMGDN